VASNCVTSASIYRGATEKHYRKHVARAAKRGPRRIDYTARRRMDSAPRCFSGRVAEGMVREAARRLTLRVVGRAGAVEERR